MGATGAAEKNKDGKAVPRASKTLSAPHTRRFLDLDPDKLRGGYYTSEPIAEWLTEWAVRTPYDQVLEPGSGDIEV